MRKIREWRLVEKRGNSSLMLTGRTSFGSTSTFTETGANCQTARTGLAAKCIEFFGQTDGAGCRQGSCIR